MKEISIIIPLSTRLRVRHADNCLNSIKSQLLPPGYSLEIIISFTYLSSQTEGGVNRNQSEIEALAKKYGATLFVKRDCSPEYSLAFARNVGGMRSKGAILGFVDCDLVLHPQTLKYAIQYMSHVSAVAVHCFRMKEGPENPIYRDLKNFDNHLVLGKRDDAGKGGCFFIDRSLFLRMHGYDERFYGWGYEDVDMLNRLSSRQIMVGYLLSEGIYAMHQYHEPNTWSSDERAEKNRLMVYSSSDFVRNPKGFAGLSLDMCEKIG